MPRVFRLKVVIEVEFDISTTNYANAIAEAEKALANVKGAKIVGVRAEAE